MSGETETTELTTRIGVITPDDAINDDEYNNYLPPGVTLLWTRYRTASRDEPISVEMVSSYGSLDAIREAAETLRITRPRVTIFCCNSCSFVYGPEGDARIRRVIADAATGVATSITDSQVQALRALGARRVALVAPYPPSVTEKLVNYLHQCDIEVQGATSLNLTSEWQIGNTPSSVWYDVATKADDAKADALLLACSGIRAFEVIPRLEQDLGKPVVSPPAAVMWHALRLADVATKLSGRGQLFETR